MTTCKAASRYCQEDVALRAKAHGWRPKGAPDLKQNEGVTGERGRFNRKVQYRLLQGKSIKMGGRKCGDPIPTYYIEAPDMPPTVRDVAVARRIGQIAHDHCMRAKLIAGALLADGSYRVMRRGADVPLKNLKPLPQAPKISKKMNGNQTGKFAKPKGPNTLTLPTRAFLEAWQFQRIGSIRECTCGFITAPGYGALTGS